LPTVSRSSSAEDWAEAGATAKTPIAAAARKIQAVLRKDHIFRIILAYPLSIPCYLPTTSTVRFVPRIITTSSGTGGGGGAGARTGMERICGRGRGSGLGGRGVLGAP